MHQEFKFFIFSFLILSVFDCKKQASEEVMPVWLSGPNEEELPAGTYIGRIESQIGYSSGAHLHIEDPHQKADRETLLKWLKGDKN